MLEWIKASPENERIFWSQMYTKLLPKDIQATVRHVADASQVSDDELATIAAGDRDVAEQTTPKTHLN